MPTWASVFLRGKKTSDKDLHLDELKPVRNSVDCCKSHKPRSVAASFRASIFVYITEGHQQHHILIVKALFGMISSGIFGEDQQAHGANLYLAADILNAFQIRRNFA